MPVVEESDVVFVSVKPGVVPIVLDEVKTIAANKLFISVAMGITIKQIENVGIAFYIGRLCDIDSGFVALSI